LSIRRASSGSPASDQGAQLADVAVPADEAAHLGREVAACGRRPGISASAFAQQLKMKLGQFGRRVGAELVGQVLPDGLVDLQRRLRFCLPAQSGSARCPGDHGTSQYAGPAVDRRQRLGRTGPVLLPPVEPGLRAWDWAHIVITIYAGRPSNTLTLLSVAANCRIRDVGASRTMSDTHRPLDEPVNHLISRRVLDDIYHGRANRGSIETLWQSERSRRLLLLNSVIDRLVARPSALGPLGPVDDAVAVLEVAESADQESFRQVLLYPSVGSWAAHALRRLLEFSSSDSPLWMDVGLIRAVALVAAHRAGLDWHTLVPLRNGRVMFPGIGMASFDDGDRWGVAEAATTGGLITIRAGSTTVSVEPAARGWWPLRRIRCGREPALSVVLDDIDPFRELADPAEPERLSDAEVAAWSHLLERAWQLLCHHHALTADAMAAGLISLNPLPPDDDLDGRSASTGEAFGALLVARPADPLTLAAALVHEFAHLQLGGLLHLIDMTIDSDDARFYAPWRDDPRPLPGLLQGIYAFTSIAAFWRTQLSVSSGPDEAVAAFEYALARGQVSQVAEALAGSDLLTTEGSQLIEALRRRIGSWSPRPVAAAELALAAHRTGWRLRHLRPDPAAVDALVTAWASGGDAVVKPHFQVAVGDSSWWFRSTLTLIRRWVAAQAQGDRELRGAPGYVALVKGDVDAARAAYLRRISADAEDLDAWSGLALTVAGPARIALTEYPSLVMAVHLRLCAVVEPLALAQWIGEAVSAGAEPS
jgi:HEXXH motif-containing protein